MFSFWNIVVTQAYSEMEMEHHLVDKGETSLQFE